MFFQTAQDFLSRMSLESIAVSTVTLTLLWEHLGNDPNGRGDPSHDLPTKAAARRLHRYMSICRES